MNVSAISYNNYPQGSSTHPVSRIRSQSSEADLKNELQLNPVTNPALPDQSTQISTTDKSVSASSSSDPTIEKQTDPKQDATKKIINGHALTQADMQLIATLKQVDSEVRSHEMAHVAAGGRLITSGANFSYKKGPDGKNYAIGGEVGIDTSPVPGDPAATIKKMRQVKSAALAPADPSAQDLKVASQAVSMALKATSELMLLTAREQAESNEKAAFGKLKNAADTYEKVNNLPETETSTFQIAV